MAPLSNRRAGFTLIELLAVICVIAVIISLMLPALAQAREAARRSACLNNLKQIALALHNYECANKVLPSGAVDRSGPVHNRPDARAMAWTVQLLPYLEQNGVYQAVDMNQSVRDLANSTASSVRISSLSCPSDPRPWVAGSVGGNSYAGCHHDIEAPIDVDNHGVFFLNSQVRTADITDGTSFTLYIGEKLVQPGDLDFWMSGTRATLRNTGTPINAAPPVGDDLIVGGFASRHPGGANFAFGDGSIHFLSERINPTVYRLLGHRDDGEPISAGAFGN